MQSAGRCEVWSVKPFRSEESYWGRIEGENSFTCYVRNGGNLVGEGDCTLEQPTPFGFSGTLHLEFGRQSDACCTAIMEVAPTLMKRLVANLMGGGSEALPVFSRVFQELLSSASIICGDPSCQEGLQSAAIEPLGLDANGAIEDASITEQVCNKLLGSNQGAGSKPALPENKDSGNDDEEEEDEASDPRTSKILIAVLVPIGVLVTVLAVGRYLYTSGKCGMFGAHAAAGTRYNQQLPIARVVECVE